MDDPLVRLLTAVAQDGDRAAFKSLFEVFAPRVKGFMARQGADPQMADDIVQQTMINVWRRAAQFDPEKASVATWIFTIARNARIDMLRRANRPEPDPNDPALMRDPDPDPHLKISRDQEAKRLHAAVERLPKEQQEVLRLAFFEDKAHGVVAEELGLPLGTVKSRIRLAVSRIRAELGDMR